MFLIIPVIEIRNGLAVRQVQGIEGVRYPGDPADLAYLWRRENAKILHIVDKDSLSSETTSNIEAIRKVVKAVDIPIEVSGGIRTYEHCKELFSAGVFRVVIDSIGISDTSIIKRLVEEYLPHRIVAGFTAVMGRVLTSTYMSTETTAVELGMKMKDCGITRVVYREFEKQSGNFVINIDLLRSFAMQTRLRVTAAGGIPDVKMLWALQELEQFGVDSIVIGKSLYENRFPCQQLWRMVEADEFGVSGKQN
ncbi:MAG TPA: HisA/HisF-related TIM barrel protein [Candidatus Kapabacteria bacterium]|nr:HisA/HisF-related TIM barrel protein [Candidatus Kapabacteria bacterium]